LKFSVAAVRLEASERRRKEVGDSKKEAMLGGGCLAYIE
jgi:hypothetical protein